MNMRQERETGMKIVVGVTEINMEINEVQEAIIENTPENNELEESLKS